MVERKVRKRSREEEEEEEGSMSDTRQNQKGKVHLVTFE